MLNAWYGKQYFLSLLFHIQTNSPPWPRIVATVQKKIKEVLTYIGMAAACS